jgi:hypothetical protein
VVDCEILKGDKIVDKKVTAVKPGQAFFYTSTDSQRIFDAERPIRGDVWLLRLGTIRADLRNMKQFQYKILEKVLRPGDGNIASSDAEKLFGNPDPNDDLPNFEVPKTQPEAPKDRSAKTKGKKK